MSLGERLDRLCTFVALCGGLMLAALVGVECVSVTGRSLPELLAWTGLTVHPLSVPGDAEIARMLTTMALFAFLPYCQMRGGHIRVEVFSRYFSNAMNGILDRLWSIFFAVLGSVLAWRLSLGWLNKWSNGDSTMVLQAPETVPFGAAVFCTLLLVAAVLQSLVTPRTSLTSSSH